jgi:chromosome segregation ATPase
MQLPDFIRRMLGFAEKVEANLNAEKDLTTARARVTELEGQLSAGQVTIAQRDKLITDHSTTIADLNSKLTAKDGEIAALKLEVASEKKRATDTLAAQGLAPELIPAAELGEAGKPGKESAWEKYCQLLAKPSTAREAGQFYAENKEAIFKSKPKL